MTVKTIFGNITASKDVLNELSIYASEASKEYERKGYFALQERAQEVANTIFNELDKTGFYK